MSDDFDITLERKLGSKAAGTGGGVSEVRRIELITGIGRRRRWSREDKAHIVVESLGLCCMKAGAQHRGMGLLQIRHRRHVVAKAGQSPHSRSVTTRQRLRL